VNFTSASAEISLILEVPNMAESKLRDLAIQFSVDVIRLCESIRGHSSLTNQLERSATSIGANLHEANYAHSRADFIAKLQIALKECYETEYWLTVFEKANLCENDLLLPVKERCGTIRRMLSASVHTARANDSGKS
jgi:four helix bundle protein